MNDAVAAVYADEWGRIVATLIRLTGDWDLDETRSARQLLGEDRPEPRMTRVGLQRRKMLCMELW